MRILVSMGRGGTGKTCFMAMMADYFIRKGETPLLLVDLDPDQSLGEMIGVDLETEGKKTIAELVEETFIEKGGTTVGIAPSDRIEETIWREGMYEGKNLDFISIGTKWVEGCYCMPDAALKIALSHLTRQYRYVIVDAPGGLEHLNRRITVKVDDIFDIFGPSSKSFAHIRRARRVADESGVSYNHLYAVGGFLCTKDLQNRFSEIEGIRYLGTIATDDEVASRALNGESLLYMDPYSPGPASVSAIMQEAGY